MGSQRLAAISCCFCSPWWRHQMETVSALLAICAGNSPVPGEFPAQRPVTQGFDVFFGLRPDKQLSKQSWGWWFQTPSHSLWRHRNAGEYHDNVIKWKHFPPCWPFARGIYRSPVYSPHKGQRRGALIVSLICASPNGCTNNRDTDDLRRHCAYDVSDIVQVGSEYSYPSGPFYQYGLTLIPA